MRNLNNVVLFVLVLFGSVVPVSAQSEGGGMTAGVFLLAVGAVFAILVPLGAMMITLYKWQNKLNDDAHTKIGENIERVEGKVDEVNLFLRNHFAGKKGK